MEIEGGSCALILAQSAGVSPVFVVGVLLPLIAVAVMLSLRFKRCPPNMALVVFGRLADGQSMRCLHGGGVFVWPLIQDYAYLRLTPFDVKVEETHLRSGAGELVCFEGVFQVAISTVPSVLHVAAERLLLLDDMGVHNMAKDILKGVTKDFLGSTTVDSINADPEVFLEQLRAACDEELAKIGMTALELKVERITVNRESFVRLAGS